MPKPTGPAMTAVSTGPDSFRVIYHAPVCPACGSDHLRTEEVDITDGMTETAYLCRDCGEAWPIACVTDWSVQP
jgi:predicted RNA-binding Zn-ribbon protein involved in translation (DUF1610 family)